MDACHDWVKSGMAAGPALKWVHWSLLLPYFNLFLRDILTVIQSVALSKVHLFMILQNVKDLFGHDT